MSIWLLLLGYYFIILWEIKWAATEIITEKLNTLEKKLEYTKQIFTVDIMEKIVWWAVISPWKSL